MRIRHAALAGSAVAAMSMATTLVASSQAAAAVHSTAAAPATTTVAMSPVGSAAGLLLGLVVVVLVAAVSFAFRLRVAGPGARRTIVVPEVARTAQPRAAVSFATALAD